MHCGDVNVSAELALSSKEVRSLTPWPLRGVNSYDGSAQVLSRGYVKQHS